MDIDKLFFSIVFFLLSFLLKGQDLRPTVVGNSLTLPLPAETGYACNFAEYDARKNMYIRTVSTRRYGSFVEFYDLSKSVLPKVWHFPEIAELTQFVEIEDDTFWFFDASDRWLYLIENGEVRQKIHEVKSADYIGSYTSYYADQAFNPLIYYKSGLYVVPSLMVVDSSEEHFENMGKSGFVRYYDIDQKQLNWIGHFPKASLKNDYGYLNRFSTIQLNNQLLIAPFYSNEFVLLNLDDGRMSYPKVPNDNPYYQVALPFAPLRANPKSLKDGGSAHFYRNAYYLGIIYDKYRKLYYRVKVNPTSDDNTPSDREIVVLNNDFSVKGSYKLASEIYKTDGMFVNKDGLYILNYDQYKKNNNQLIFDRFVF